MFRLRLSGEGINAGGCAEHDELVPGLERVGGVRDEDLERFPVVLRVGAADAEDGHAALLAEIRFGEGELDGLYEVLYGTVGQGSWGDADYGDDASVTLRYGLTLEDGREVMLMALFEMYTLTEINITVGR